MAKYVSLEIEKGADFEFSIAWKENNGDPVNLTGFTARMHIREAHDAIDPPLASFTTENGRITLGDAAGTIVLSMTSTDSTALTFEEGVYDLELVSSGDRVTRLIQGGIKVSPEVTR